MDSIPRTVSDRTANSGAAATGGHTTQPTVPSLAPDGIPPELRAGKRFVAWRSEERGKPEPAKVPYSHLAPKGASSTDPSHWTTFDLAHTYAEKAGLDGVMRAFDPADGLVGIDLDNCRDLETGELTPWAAEYVRRLDTYTEVSPSGRGVKLWAYGTLPPHGRKRGDVELYDRARFFTLTGQHLAGTPAAVKYRPDAITAIHREVFGAAPDPLAAATAERDVLIPALELGDEEVLRLASASPHNGERFRRLWAGDTGDYATDGNDGASEADCALCELLAYYGGPDPERIDRLIRRSGLYRDKWERVDYRERTIARALAGKARFYGDGLTPLAPTEGAVGCACRHCPAAAEVARLRRLLLDKDDRLEAQQAIIGSQRTRLDEMTGFLAHISDVLAKPNADLSAGEKVVALGLLPELHFRATYGPYTLPDGTAGSYRTASGRIRMPREVLARRTGYSPGQASKLGRQLAERDNAPFAWRTTRAWKANPDGSAGWVTTIELEPYTEHTAESLRAVATLPPRPATPKHGGSVAATAARWGRCDRHANHDVLVRGHCSTCGKVVGERMVSRAEFDVLKVQDAFPEGAITPVAVPVSVGVQEALSDGLGESVAHRNGHVPPWRCGHCGSLERYVGWDGHRRCDGCAEVVTS